MSKHLIASSLNDKEAYIYLTHSGVADSLSRQPHLGNLLAEAIKSIKLTGKTVSIQHDMGRPIGYSDIIETKPEDTVFYAHLVRSKTFTKFVKNRRTEATQHLSFSLVQDDEGHYEITSVNIGLESPATPGEEAQTDLSEPYWQDHAVVYNGQPLVGSTITKDWPY